MERRARKLVVGIMFSIMLIGLVSHSAFAAPKQDKDPEILSESTDLVLAADLAEVKATDASWKNVGNEGFSKGPVNYTSIALDNKNTPYVAYIDLEKGSKITVKKFTGNSWQTVGTEGFSAKKVKEASIVVDKNGIPYVVYIEEPKGEIIVNKFIGNKWTKLGGNVGLGDEAAIAVDSNGIPYVAYTYSAKSKAPDVKNVNGVIVSKFIDGKWKVEYIADSTKKDSLYSSPAIAIDSYNTPYIAFENAGINVVRLLGNGWSISEIKQTTSKPAKVAESIAIALDNNRSPYIAFLQNKGKATVISYNTNEYWEISKDKAEDISIDIDKDGTPYVAFVDTKDKSKAVVKKYEGGKWIAVGSDGLSKGKAKYTSLALDTNGNPYIVYSDGANGNKATVKTYAKVNEFVVTFNSNGGTEIEKQYVAYNGKAEIPAVPQKEGYIFENWYKDEELTQVFDFNTPITSDITLYAKYTAIPTAPTAELTLSIEGNGSVVDWTSGSKKSFELGTTITLNAIAGEDSTFLYWKNSSNRVASKNSEYTFELASNETLTAVFVDNNKNTVTFENGNGEIIQIDYITDEITFPKAPSMFGYKFIGWDKTIDEIKAATENIVVTALFERLEEKVTVEVYGGTGSGEYNIRDIVSVVANAPEAGQKFAYWEDELENILSYNPQYNFYAIRDVKITAVFVPESEVIVQEASIDITSVARTDDKITFIAERIVPEGNTVLSHGIIVTKNAAIGTSEADFIIGGTDVLQATSITKELIGTYILNKSAAINETWYARGYVIYKDSEGKVLTIYSSIEQDTMD
jgi:uncharacterized repeat protein (TIGR02543 family)